MQVPDGLFNSSPLKISRAPKGKRSSRGVAEVPPEAHIPMIPWKSRFVNMRSWEIILYLYNIYTCSCVSKWGNQQNTHVTHTHITYECILVVWILKSLSGVAIYCFSCLGKSGKPTSSHSSWWPILLQNERKLVMEQSLLEKKTTHNS